MERDKIKEFTREYFADFSLPDGEVSRDAQLSIIDGYVALFGDAEIPTANMMPECNGNLDEYHRILLKCIQKGEPYRLPDDVREERERLDRMGATYD
jgi:hypothetical protein